MMTTEREDIDEANEFLMSSGIESAKFENVGDMLTGVVTHAKQGVQTEFGTNKPLTWDDGSPRKQLILTIQAEPQSEDDDGLRRLFVKAQMATALRDAVRNAGENGIAIGGKIAVRYDGDGEASRQGFNPPKLYRVSYQPPPPQQFEVPDEDMPF